jgi:hypothetical protein
MEEGSDRDQNAEIPLGDGTGRSAAEEGLLLAGLEDSLQESESEMKMFLMQRTMSSDRWFGSAPPRVFDESWRWSLVGGSCGGAAAAQGWTLSPLLLGFTVAASW